MATRTTMTLETITPAKAEAYLKHNTSNRRIRPRKVERYTKVIREGRFQTTHQGIAFNCDGTLLDGQHRLSAIVAAGKAVRMWVARHLPRESLYGIDQGAVRRPLDIIGPLGIQHSEELTNAHCATARAMASGMYPGILGRNLAANDVFDWTNEDVLEFISLHFDAIHFACSLPLGECRNGTIRGVLARAWYTEDRERIAEFAEVLRTSIAASRGDSGAAKFRDFYMKSGRGSGSSALRAEIYGKCEAALCAFLGRRPLSRLAAVESERFPIPGEGA